jgi:ankyrin repeat protein
MQADGWTVLQTAAFNGHMDIVIALLAAGANVSATAAVRGLVSCVCGGPRRTQCIGLVVWQRSPVEFRGDVAF